MAWMRDQPWFDGRFATFGASYLGFTQWALLVDPPPELVTAIIQVGPHDFGKSLYEGGAMALLTLLSWADLVTHQEQYTGPRAVLRMATGTRGRDVRQRLRELMHRHPVVDHLVRLNGRFEGGNAVRKLLVGINNQ